MLQQIITEYNRKGEFMLDETEANKNYKPARYEGSFFLNWHSAGL